MRPTLSNDFVGRLLLLFVRPFDVRPKVLLWRRIRRLKIGQNRLVTIERNANRCPVAGRLLEYGAHLPPPVDLRGQPCGAFGSDIAKLHARLVEHCDSVFVTFVAGFAAQIDRIAGLAQGYGKAPCWAALVGKVSADDGEGEMVGQQPGCNVA